MTIPYDVFIEAFLSKITEYDLLMIVDQERESVVDGYLKRAISNTLFTKVCGGGFISSADDENRIFEVDIEQDLLDEIIEIVSEGMLIQWLKPYLYRQELLENMLNTRDYTTYSPAELLMRVGGAYNKAQKDYTQMIREYSYNHGDLTDLHI